MLWVFKLFVRVFFCAQTGVLGGFAFRKASARRNGARRRLNSAAGLETRGTGTVAANADSAI